MGENGPYYGDSFEGIDALKPLVIRHGNGIELGLINCRKETKLGKGLFRARFQSLFSLLVVVLL